MITVYFYISKYKYYLYLSKYFKMWEVHISFMLEKTMSDINESCFAKSLSYVNDSNLIIFNLLF